MTRTRGGGVAPRALKKFWEVGYFRLFLTVGGQEQDPEPPQMRDPEDTRIEGRWTYFGAVGRVVTRFGFAAARLSGFFEFFFKLAAPQLQLKIRSQQRRKQTASLSRCA